MLRERRIMNRKVQTVNRWKMSALLMSLSAVVLVLLAAAPAPALASHRDCASDTTYTVPSLPSNITGDSACSFAPYTIPHPSVTDLVGDGGSLSVDYRIPYPSTHLGGYIDRAVVRDASPNLPADLAEETELGRVYSYGTGANGWRGYVDDQVAPRNYGTGANWWRGYVD